MSETQEVEVLTIDNEQGAVYAIPLDVLEAFKVPDEDAKQLAARDEAGDDDEVSGYFWGGWGRPAPRPYRPPVSYRPQQSFNPGSFWGNGGRVIPQGGGNVIASGGGN